MDQITVKNSEGLELTFSVSFESDSDHGAPWEEEDGHGYVTGWERRDKKPGELILSSDRGEKMFYDFAGACKKALAEGWDSPPYNTGEQTKRQQAAKAARADFENLRQYCAGQWEYLAVTVTLLDQDGEATDIFDCMGGVSNQDNYGREVAEEMAKGLADGFGKDWSEMLVKTYGRN